MTQPPLVLHLLFRFDTGGLENGVVNLINHLPAAAYRHAVVALDQVVPAFARRVHPDVEFVSLHKRPGQTWWLYPQLYRLFRQLRPAIVHTRNLAALECQVPAWLAGVPVRIHGEHGRDVGDLDGSNRRYQWMRRVYRPFVHHYVALSQDLQAYLTGPIRVAPGRVTRICNGVDSERFHPAGGSRSAIAGSPFNDAGLWVVGTVGRMQTVKSQHLLAQAFVRALQLVPALRQRLRLVMVGEGPLLEQARGVLEAVGSAELAWLPGERTDVPDVMRGLDLFVLPSVAEGISNTILEAMASGLPVLASRVGGNAELVSPGVTGELLPAGDVEAMAAALVRFAGDPDRARRLGQAGRMRVEQQFSLSAMVGSYGNLYQRQLAAAGLGGL